MGGRIATVSFAPGDDVNGDDFIGGDTYVRVWYIFAGTHIC